MGDAKTYWVYILTNAKNRVLYTGVTSDLQRRVWQHKSGETKGFAARYNCNKLVWFGETAEVNEAISLEKTIKAGSRAKKVARIEAMNPDWRDLSSDW